MKNEKNQEQINWMELVNKEAQLRVVQDANQYSEKFGLSLTKEDAELIIAEKNRTLKAEKRVEFGETIIPKISYTFCDSQYIMQDQYVEMLSRLQAIRAGYHDYQVTGGHGEFQKVDLVKRWDRDLFLQALEDLF
ncbi:MAG: hypothetical protein GX567_13665 [Clostridia bacterium]|nr:hypothetical protein [Clostridia bacterium]